LKNWKIGWINKRAGPLHSAARPLKQAMPPCGPRGPPAECHSSARAQTVTPRMSCHNHAPLVFPIGAHSFALRPEFCHYPPYPLLHLLDAAKSSLLSPPCAHRSIIARLCSSLDRRCRRRRLPPRADPTRPPLLVHRGPPPSRSPPRAAGHHEVEAAESTVVFFFRRDDLDGAGLLRSFPGPVDPPSGTTHPRSTSLFHQSTLATRGPLPHRHSPSLWHPPWWSNRFGEPLSSLLPQTSSPPNRLALETLRDPPRSQPPPPKHHGPQDFPVLPVAVGW
jgi:hypothetical protein